MRYGMIIDLDRCIGCDACAIGCKQANGTPQGVFWSRVERTEVGVYPKASVEYMPMLCMHCADAPCIEKCPSGASFKREDGIVSINDDICIGCCYCIAACPYGARTFDFGERKSYFPGQPATNYEKIYNEANPNRNVVSKCTFCADRLKAGDKPLCAQTCPTDARIFGDLHSPEMKNRIKENHGYQDKVGMGTNPSVYYLPRREHKFD